MSAALRLKHKLILLILAVVTLAVLGMLHYSTRTFISEKEEYLSELTLQASTSSARLIERELSAVREQCELFDAILTRAQGRESAPMQRLLQDAFAVMKSVEWLEVHDESGLVARVGAAEAFTPPAARGPLKTRLWAGDSRAVIEFALGDRRYFAGLRAKVLTAHVSQNEALALSLVTADGRILARNIKFETSRSPAALEDLVQSSSAFGAIGREVELGGGERGLASVSAVSGVENAYVVSQVGLGEIRPMLYRMLKNSWLFIVALTGFSILIGTLFSAQLMRPIEELTRAAGLVARGNWIVAIRHKSRDEIGRLVDSFTSMGSELAKREKELQAAQDELVRAERLAVLGKFGAGIAHEVKNPLSTILGYSQLLQKKLPADAGETPVKYLGFIMDETRRASRIITELLTFARQKPPVKAALNANELLDYAYEAVTPAALAASVQVTKEGPDGTVVLSCDRDQIMQVLSNVTTNAVHALEEMTDGRARRLSLKLRSEKGYAVFEIADNGPGIAPENLGKIFEPFFTTKTTGRGTGLGLSLCHGIIQQHGGRIEVSSAPGLGTTFKILLPV
ncbi:MAG TPA: ATP-binding protein [Bdellovibrionales bacterium]|nr:ATP-binding protein [Bdellovibrionales bacterium]